MGRSSHPGGRRSGDFAALAKQRPQMLGIVSSMSTFHDFVMDSITGEPIALSTYAGKTVLVVNVASA